MFERAAQKLFLVPVAAIVMAGTFVAAATGAAAAEPPVMTVSHGGLDLLTSDGIRAFDQRIATSARRTCANINHGIDIGWRAERLCVADLVTMADAGRATAIADAGSQRRELASR